MVVKSRLIRGDASGHAVADGRSFRDVRCPTLQVISATQTGGTVAAIGTFYSSIIGFDGGRRWLELFTGVDSQKRTTSSQAYRNGSANDKEGQCTAAVTETFCLTVG